MELENGNSESSILFLNGSEARGLDKLFEVFTTSVTPSD